MRVPAGAGLVVVLADNAGSVPRRLTALAPNAPMPSSGRSRTFGAPLLLCRCVGDRRPRPVSVAVAISPSNAGHATWNVAPASSGGTCADRSIEGVGAERAVAAPRKGAFAHRGEAEARRLLSKQNLLTSNFSMWKDTDGLLTSRPKDFVHGEEGSRRPLPRGDQDRAPAPLDLEVEENRRPGPRNQPTRSARGRRARSPTTSWSPDWRILSSLRWASPPYRRSAGALAKIADLSSGAMTNRLDQLEVRRAGSASIEDRRGVLVEPTKKGRGLWEGAIGVQARKEALPWQPPRRSTIASCG